MLHVLSMPLECRAEACDSQCLTLPVCLRPQGNKQASTIAEPKPKALDTQARHKALCSRSDRLHDDALTPKPRGPRDHINMRIPQHMLSEIPLFLRLLISMSDSSVFVVFGPLKPLTPAPDPKSSIPQRPFGTAVSAERLGVW